MKTPDSPTTSFISMKSDRSIDHPPKFSDGKVPSTPSKKAETPASPVPSLVSLGSDESSDWNNWFDDKSLLSTLRNREPCSPAASYFSMRTAKSMKFPHNENILSGRRTQTKGPGSPEYNCLSVDSNKSSDLDNFSDEDIPSVSSIQTEEPFSPITNCLSVKSNQSIDHPPVFSETSNPSSPSVCKQPGCKKTGSLLQQREDTSDDLGYNECTRKRRTVGGDSCAEPKLQKYTLEEVSGDPEEKTAELSQTDTNCVSMPDFVVCNLQFQHAHPNQSTPKPKPEVCDDKQDFESGGLKTDTKMEQQSPLPPALQPQPPPLQQQQQQQQPPLAAVKMARHIERVAQAQQHQRHPAYHINMNDLHQQRVPGPVLGNMPIAGPWAQQVMQAVPPGQWSGGSQGPIQTQLPPQQQQAPPQQPQGPQPAMPMQWPLMPQQQPHLPGAVQSPQGPPRQLPQWAATIAAGALQDLLCTLKSPSSPQQQQQVLHVLKSNPQLMAHEFTLQQQSPLPPALQPQPPPLQQQQQQQQPPLAAVKMARHIERVAQAQQHQRHPAYHINMNDLHQQRVPGPVLGNMPIAGPWAQQVMQAVPPGQWSGGSQGPIQTQLPPQQQQAPPQQPQGPQPAMPMQWPLMPQQQPHLPGAVQSPQGPPRQLPQWAATIAAGALQDPAVYAEVPELAPAAAAGAPCSQVEPTTHGSFHQAEDSQVPGQPAGPAAAAAGGPTGAPTGHASGHAYHARQAGAAARDPSPGPPAGNATAHGSTGIAGPQRAADEGHPNPQLQKMYRWQLLQLQQQQQQQQFQQGAVAQAHRQFPQNQASATSYLQLQMQQQQQLTMQGGGAPLGQIHRWGRWVKLAWGWTEPRTSCTNSACSSNMVA